MFVKICGSARRCYLDESRAPTERDQEKLRLTQDCCLVRPLAGQGRAEAGGVSQDQADLVTRRARHRANNSWYSRQLR